MTKKNEYTETSDISDSYEYTETSDISESYESESISIESLDSDSDDVFPLESIKIDKKKKIIYEDLDKEILESIRKDEKDKVLKDLIQKGLVKTCTSCGQFFENFQYKTRKCKDCFKDYTSHKYLEKKKLN